MKYIFCPNHQEGISAPYSTDNVIEIQEKNHDLPGQPSDSIPLTPFPLLFPHTQNYSRRGQESIGATSHLSLES
jgi:hypothetical protein